MSSSSSCPSAAVLSAAAFGAIAGAVVTNAIGYKTIKEAKEKVAAAAGFPKTPLYKSTRGWAGDNNKGVDFETAVLTGLGYDGGLLVPTFVPAISRETLESWYGLSFQDLAFEIMSMYIPRDQISSGDLKDIIKRSYQTFRHEEVTPVIRVGDEGQGPKVLELFHGPTFAFKDVALQFLGNLFEHFIGKRGNSITVLGATSGDTGSSAIYGLRGKKGVKVFILFPEGRVSPIQERQMTTVLDKNIQCVAVKGTFDDAQAIVKTLFNDHQFREKVHLAAVNSINWARILAQIVYYFYSYFRLVPKAEVGAPLGKISFAVPTGNFGDILAGYYAKQMGLPVNQLIVATNENDILHGFFSKGEYIKPSSVKTTLAPSMDICVSSNFERFLYHMNSDDPKAMSDMMKEFDATGKLIANDTLYKRCKNVMISERLSTEEIRKTIRDNYVSYGYLLDPHSAIGVGAAAKLASRGALDKTTPVVCLACAHWGKFSTAVESAIGSEEFATCQLPKQLAQLQSLPTRKEVVEAGVEAVRNVILSKIANM